MITKNPLLDKEFLIKLDKQEYREVYAKIIALTFEEYPTEEITGRVTGGSVNIDGDSAVRRTCSLTLVAQDININDFYWGLNTKFQLYVGLKNTVDPSYDDIIWFKQGTYLITSFSTSLNVTQYTINISGKDKMCLLNGDIGGVIESLSADFGKVDILDENNQITGQEDVLIKDIIKEAVHHYGKEPFQNIIIDDLDITGLQYVEYRGDVPLYILINKDADESTDMLFEHDITKADYFLDAELKQPISIRNDLNPPDKKIIYETLSKFNDESGLTPTIIYSSSNRRYTVLRVEYGECCGYRLTDLTYAGSEGESSKDLILSAGDSITSMLDKIVHMLGDYEYFYDLEGRFHFQRKKAYINTSWNSITAYGDEEFVDSAVYSSSTSYSFTDSVLISSFSNNPNLLNLRNDFSIWGEKQNTQAQKNGVNFHLRYAIDKKPVYYKTYNGVEYTVNTTTPKIQEIQEQANQELAEIELEYHRVIANYNGYNKKKNPNGLSDDWWDVLDWAEKYALIAGTYPTKSLYHYVSSSDYWRYDDIMKYFNLPQTGKTYYYPYSSPYSITYTGSNGYWGSTTNGSYSVNVFDINEEDGSMGYFGHGTVCSHLYSVFLQNKEHGITSYVYKPTFPEVEWKEYEDRIQIKKKETQQKIEEAQSNANLNCEWRELIYQMAIDYYRYGHKEDFVATIAKNNSTYYPTGYTGYEQYYADMQGFWRYFLYDPTLTPLTQEFLANDPDSDIATYYKWTDTDIPHNQGYFTPYSFRQATGFKEVPNIDFYYPDGTISVASLNSLISSNSIEPITKTNLTTNTNETVDLKAEEWGLWKDKGAHPLHYYQFLREGFYQKFTMYYNCNLPGAKCYNYGLALDLTDMSPTKRYYKSQSDGDGNITYTPVPLVKVENKYTHIGTVTEEAYNANASVDAPRRGPYYIEKSKDTYELATEYSEVREYYIPQYVTNFNEFDENGKGILYYQNRGYEEMTRIDKAVTRSYFTQSFVSVGAEVSPESFYEGTTNYYVKIGNRYVKQNVYLPSKKDEYYIESYTFAFQINKDDIYQVKSGDTWGVATDFVRGNEYRKVDATTSFVYENNTKYYSTSGYEVVKDARGMDIEGGPYVLLKDKTSTVLQPPFEFLPSNIYNGYTVVAEPKSEELYYVKELPDGAISASKRKALVRFIRGVKYFYFLSPDPVTEEFMRPAKPEDLTSGIFTQFYYFADGEYKNCFESTNRAIQEAIKNNGNNPLNDAQFSAELAAAATTTGVSYELVLGNNEQNTYAKVVGIDFSRKDIFLYEPKLLQYQFLKYQFVQPVLDPKPGETYLTYDADRYISTIATVELIDGDTEFYELIPFSELEGKLYTTDRFNPRTYWTMDLQSPQNLVFWFDFLDTSMGGELSQYGADSIGSRPKAINDENIKAIYYRDIPQAIFMSAKNPIDKKDRKKGYSYLQTNESVENLFVVGAVGKTAYDQLDAFLYNYSYCTESVTINALPVYYLEPNTRIFVYDSKSGINGEYLVSKISLPLAYNGTMSITATKAVDRIY